MGTETLHIVFTPAAGGYLREALMHVGRQDVVVFLTDSFELGPINPPEPEARKLWIEGQSGFEDWNWPYLDARVFWQHALSPGYRRKVAWPSRRSVHDYCGFLEWLWRLGDAPCEIVDMTDVKLRTDGDATQHAVFSLGGLTADDILGAGLLDSVRELTPELREQYRSLWGRLRVENGPLRVLTPEGFVSAPISYFDEMLLSHVPPRWEPAETPVIAMAVHFAEIGLFQADMLFLQARVGALVKEGKVEARGDLADLRNCEIRCR